MKQLNNNLLLKLNYGTASGEILRASHREVFVHE